MDTSIESTDNDILYFASIPLQPNTESDEDGCYYQVVAQSTEPVSTNFNLTKGMYTTYCKYPSLLGYVPGELNHPVIVN